MLLPSDLYSLIYIFVELKVKRLINKEMLEYCALEYGLTVKFNWKLISHYFYDFQYPLMMSKTYTGKHEHRSEQIIYVANQDDNYFTFNIQEYRLEYYNYHSGEYDYDCRTEYKSECCIDFEYEYIFYHQPIRYPSKKNSLFEKADYEIDLNNKRIILIKLGCGKHIKEILMKEVYNQYQKDNLIKKRLWFELNSMRLNDCNHYELYRILEANEEKMKEDIDILYRDILFNSM